MSKQTENDDLSTELNDLDNRLQSFKNCQKSPRYSGNNSSSNAKAVGRMMWIAFHVVSDLIAGVLCGLCIGYGFDSMFKTRPIFIAIFLVIGSIAGVVNVVRFLQKYDERQNEKPQQQNQDKD